MGKRKKLEALLGSEVSKVSRIGKYIIFEFRKATDTYFIINHLSMSGGWLFRKITEKSPIHTRLTFSFSKDGDAQALDFVDARHFGRLEFHDSIEFWSEKIQNKLSSLGPDVLNSTITSEILNQRIHDFTEIDPRWEIKSLLMEQTFVAGIGNIYASEICYLANINPYRKAASLTQEEIKRLEDAIPVIIKTAYESGGSTIRTYKSPIGQSGWTERMVYGLKYCRLDKSPISKGPQAGRTTYWCPRCQPM